MNSNYHKLAEAESAPKIEESGGAYKIVEPKAYVLKLSDPRFTFKNFYIEYGRFHFDQTNIFIHVIFIPIIIMTSFGFGNPLQIKFDFRNGLDLKMIQMGIFDDKLMEESVGDPKLWIFCFLQWLWCVTNICYLFCDPIIAFVCFIPGIICQ